MTNTNNRKLPTPKAEGVRMTYEELQRHHSLMERHEIWRQEHAIELAAAMPKEWFYEK